MKVSELAAELKKQNKEIIDKAAELGIDAKGATKNLTDAEADRIRNGFDESAEKAAEEKKARLMPRRIAKAEMEEAERAKAEAEAAEEARRLREEEEAAMAAVKKAPQLKVAKKADTEPKPPRKKVKADDAGGGKPDRPKAAHEAEKAGAKTGVKAPDEALPVKTAERTGEQTKQPQKSETKFEEKTKPGAEEAAKAGAGAVAGTEAERKQEQGIEAAAQEPAKAGERTPQRPKTPRPGAGEKGKPGEASRDKKGRPGEAQRGEKGKPGETQRGEKGKPGEAGRGEKGKPGEAQRIGKAPDKAPGDAKKAEDAKAQDKKAGEKKDDKDKKGGKSKDGKGEDAQSAKKKARNARKPGRVDDFRGSAKNPILDDGSLEKEKRKKHRAAKQPIAAAEQTIVVPEGTFVVNVPITVAGFAEQIERSTSEIILALMKMGVIANINQNLDEETVQLLSLELGVPVMIGKDEGEIIEEGLEDTEDDPDDLEPRPPIITVMGHVDHGKTSLLDAIRNTRVTAGEEGGITQHIGASEVTAPSGERIVFLDTPGHEAFTAMRSRGAHVTDIAVLVVAADDGVMPQTIESINHAKAAGVPVIVAINKIDKEGANPDRVKQELSDNGVLVEEWGGNVISVPVSAKTGEGIGNLLEMILLQAEVLELMANPGRKAIGTVIEARLDKSKGPLATLLVLNGTLKDKMSIVAGTTSAKIRMMSDFKGKTIRSAGPATAVEITGFLEVPQSGDEFRALDDDRMARDIAEKRRVRQREQVMAKTRGTSLENLFSRIREGEVKELKLIIKADVQGSLGAIAASLENINSPEVRVNMIHRGVGTVTESDVMLASTSGAIIVGFNVRPSTNVTSLAEREGVEIRLYRIIYDVIDEVEAALKGMLDPVYREVVLGKAEVRETFRLPNGHQIAGSYITEGKILRNVEIRLVRDGVVIHEGKIGSLRRFKDDVREVDRGYECGIGIEGYNDVKIGDEIEAFIMEEIERV